ncbi:bifunctional pyr operon transcriptional regulator/uracil phosphoribosyltransferase PyrR [Phaeocystidibacter luteus]|uniref:Bifunctional pyr operon transcriptional regulator/uracil phosphoribosyltransferase PyrR n=1 Tax=Phaeocystidibacter luteus TaxID=911197 RepID=A0A6N6RMN5_9FLAO|nr:bifunctional pyr operon transcriptional regulator/uracil phosphoribosyltransferase PyrR [Phaeocystidibacter luteus]KAB2814808.1 bifunctional pyr operon transcriptional regulator/uracil phosphoribosyltransferase PyrR [Phaeocystidibacter luteus]
MITKNLIGPKEIDVILNRLACQLVENHSDFENTVLISLQPRGLPLLSRLSDILKSQYGISDIPTGRLDTTFYRDDFRRRDSPLKANQTRIDFLIEGKRVVFVDDVLFTGRSIRAALDAVLSFGRPSEIELLVLVDRRFSRELPIQPDYVGRQVDSIASERVLVEWDDTDEMNRVSIVQSRNDE